MADHPSNRPDLDNLAEIFTYHPATERQRLAYETLRKSALSLAANILAHCPPCADTSAAIRKVREAVMTANAAIALSPKEEG